MLSSKDSLPSRFIQLFLKNYVPLLFLFFAFENNVYACAAAGYKKEDPKEMHKLIEIMGKSDSTVSTSNSSDTSGSSESLPCPSKHTPSEPAPMIFQNAEIDNGLPEIIKKLTRELNIDDQTLAEIIRHIHMIEDHKIQKDKIKTLRENQTLTPKQQEQIRKEFPIDEDTPECWAEQE